MVELKDQNDKKFNVVSYRICVGSEESANEYEGRARQMKIVTEKLEILNELYKIIASMVEEEESTTYEKLTELINRYDTKNKLEELNHGI